MEGKAQSPSKAGGPRLPGAPQPSTCCMSYRGALPAPGDGHSRLHHMEQKSHLGEPSQPSDSREVMGGIVVLSHWVWGLVTWWQVTRQGPKLAHMRSICYLESPAPPLLSLQRKPKTKGDVATAGLQARWKSLRSLGRGRGGAGGVLDPAPSATGRLSSLRWPPFLFLIGTLMRAEGADPLPGGQFMPRLSRTPGRLEQQRRRAAGPEPPPPVMD